MRHDHQEFHGTPAAPVAPGDTHPRTPAGRFTGPGCVPVASPPAAPDFTPTDAAHGVLTDQIDRALRTLLASGWTPESKTPAPVVALKASPGAGKSRATRARLAQIQGLGGDIVWHAPTLALADEAADDARGLGADAHTFRGRSATDPATDAPMCAKADLAEDIARLGLPVQTTLCRRVEKDGTEHLCPHFHACPYQQQRAALPDTPIQHYMPTSYLTLPSPTGRDIALRVIDETFWRHLVRIARIPLDAFVAPRKFFPQPSREPEKSKAAGKHADLRAAARVVADHLVSAVPLDDLPLSAPDLDGFAALEGHACPPDPDIRPDQATSAQKAEVARAQAARHGAATFARLWRLLAVAKRQRRARSERIRIETDAEGARQVRLFDLRALPRDAPILLLDADADPRILEALAPGAQIETLTLRPNADIVQLADRRMSNRALLTQQATRQEWCRSIRREVLFDRYGPQGGVLVGATRKVVRAFFEDAGHDFAEMSPAASTPSSLRRSDRSSISPTAPTPAKPGERCPNNCAPAGPSWPTSWTPASMTCSPTCPSRASTAPSCTARTRSSA